MNAEREGVDVAVSAVLPADPDACREFAQAAALRGWRTRDGLEPPAEQELSGLRQPGPVTQLEFLEALKAWGELFGWPLALQKNRTDASMKAFAKRFLETINRDVCVMRYWLEARIHVQGTVEYFPMPGHVIEAAREVAKKRRP